MPAVEPGDRLILRTDAGSLALRALQAVDLVGPWRVPVLAAVGRDRPSTGILEVAATSGGTVRLPARLRLVDGVLTLEAGHADAPTGTFTALDGEQRRDDVRGEVHLPVRLTGLDVRAELALRGAVVTGHTLDVSAGGARLVLPGLAEVPAAGSRLFVEVELPEGTLAPAVVAVVDAVRQPRPNGVPGGDRQACVQVRFVDLAPIDRERIVRLVFDAERRLLAERRGRLR
jgi:hypothetical protein